MNKNAFDCEIYGSHGRYQFRDDHFWLLLLHTRSICEFDYGAYQKLRFSAVTEILLK